MGHPSVEDVAGHDEQGLQGLVSVIVAREEVIMMGLAVLVAGHGEQGLQGVSHCVGDRGRR